MMTHRSKKPYECQFDACDKSYCDARSLRRHLENVHNQHAVDDMSGVSFNDPNNQRFQFGTEYRKQFLNSHEKAWQPDGQSPGYQGSPISPHPNSPLPRRWGNPYLE